jgi:hypothetical protein
MTQGSIEEILPLISPTSRHSSWGKLNQWHSFLYAMTLSVRPKIVIETGVLYGHSSAAILAALEDNRAGRLFSVELPIEQHQSVIVGRQHVQVGLTSNQLSIGCVVPSLLRSRWSLRFGDSLALLPGIFDELGPISMFIHDSLHTYDHMMAEFQLGYDALEPGGMLISDDIDYNSAWSDFCLSERENWKALSKGSDTTERFGFLIKSTRSGQKSSLPRAD